MPITLQLPDDFPNLPVITEVGDAADHLLLTVTHLKTPQSSDVEYAATYLVEENWANPVLIGRDDLPAKTSAGFARLRPGTKPDRQTVELVVTEAGTAAGPGSSNVVHVYTFEDAAPGRAPDPLVQLLRAFAGGLNAIAITLGKVATALAKGLEGLG